MQRRGYPPDRVVPSVARTCRFVQLDVFTDRIFGGNPLAVFPDAEGLSHDEMQLLAREMNLSETTFVLPATDPKAAYQVRIFTPVTELPYAGHPSVGTAWHLATAGRILPGTSRVHQQVKAGILPIDVEWVDGKPSRVHTIQAKPVFDAPETRRERVAHALGLAEQDLHPHLPIQKVSTGLAWLLVPLRDAQALDRVRPNLASFSGPDAVHYDIYPFTLAPADPATSTEARGFPMREFEDPATGSASGCLGAYLARHRVLPARDGRVSFTHAQGRHLKRPSRIRVDVRLDRAGEPLEVRVGGSAVEVLRGEVTLP